jgi:hypothetical protein
MCQLSDVVLLRSYRAGTDFFRSLAAINILLLRSLTHLVCGLSRAASLR